MCSVPQQPSGQCLTVVEAIEHGDEVMMAPPKHTPYAQLECGAKMGAVCGAAATCGGMHGGAETVVHLLSSRCPRALCSFLHVKPKPPPHPLMGPTSPSRRDRQPMRVWPAHVIDCACEGLTSQYPTCRAQG